MKYLIRTKSELALQLATDAAFAKGFIWCDGSKDYYNCGSHGAPRYLVVNYDEMQIHVQLDEPVENDGDEITIDEFITQEFKASKFRLTNDYEAKINHGTKEIVVGCQVIPFDTLRELFKVCFPDTVVAPMVDIADAREVVRIGIVRYIHNNREQFEYCVDNSDDLEIETSVEINHAHGNCFEADTRIDSVSGQIPMADYLIEQIDTIFENI